jgi:hypothetical protein
MDKASRIQARTPSDITVEVFTGPVGGIRIGEGTLLDLSLSGCLLRFSGQLKVGSTYRLHCTWKDGVLDLPGRVVREAGRSGDPLTPQYGLAFNLTYDQEKALRLLVDYVRRTYKPEEGGFMSGYWSA